MVYYTMRNLRALLFATALLIASFASISSVSNFVSAIPSEIIDDQFVFGPIVGLSENQSGAVDWIMVGNWRLNMANDTDVQNNHHSDVFNAAIEMVKPDGTARHTHTLTDFVVLNVTHPDNNATIYNGTSTVSLQAGPATDIPTSIQKSNDNVIIVNIDPESVDKHFGKLPMYGVPINPDLIKPFHMIEDKDKNVSKY
ncbi:MAG: hypothetical protein P0116_16245 [Candidatus Nitrosocosmicus sp.]|nr:hypothetical protein [Candidatus Nitrosocosmicus sp.]